MAKLYEHTQVGYVMLAVLTLGTFCATFWMVYLGFSWGLFVALVALDVSLILFSTLTVEIFEGVLEIKFGPGLIHKTFDLKNVRDCLVVTNPIYHGWGIRWMPDGWLYNVSGRCAVELKMKNGERYRIGTDVPSELAEQIRKALTTTTTKFA